MHTLTHTHTSLSHTHLDLYNTHTFLEALAVHTLTHYSLHTLGLTQDDYHSRAVHTVRAHCCCTHTHTHTSHTVRTHTLEYSHQQQAYPVQLYRHTMSAALSEHMQTSSSHITLTYTFVAVSLVAVHSHLC